VADCRDVTSALLLRDRDDDGDGHAGNGNAHADADGPGLVAHLESCAACRQVARQLRVVDGALAAACDEETAPPPPFQRLEGRAAAAARGRRRWRSLRRTLPIALVLAGAVGATLLATQVLHRPDGKRTAATGDLLDAAHGTVQTVLSNGARLTLTSGRLAVEASERRRGAIRLEAGAVFLDVPHLDEGATMTLVTDDVEVAVRGTRFDVARLPEGTRVSVTRGIVELRPRNGKQPPFLLRKGESSLIEGLSQLRERRRAAALAAFDQGDSAQSERLIRDWLQSDPPGEDAAQAHALLAWRLSARGERAAAIESYRRALALLPAGAAPLWADNASAQLALLLSRDDPRVGENAWRGYLDRFPGGVHAGFARALLRMGSRR
jgi:ferric-dicitrate binding protein FerR (iron transport regulator)